MQSRLKIQELRLRHTFHIAHGGSDVGRDMLLELRDRWERLRWSRTIRKVPKELWLLIANGPFSGAQFDGARLMIPDEAGLEVMLIGVSRVL